MSKKEHFSLRHCVDEGERGIHRYEKGELFLSCGEIEMTEDQQVNLYRDVLMT